MTQAISNLDVLLASMEPELQSGVHVFASAPLDTDLRDVAAIATFREREGPTVIVEEGEAAKAGLTPLFRSAWITLTVHSDLNAVGLMAAFARALGDANISYNVLAAAFNDPILVPVDDAGRALAALEALQKHAPARE